jgi:3-dehydroquinate synthase
MSRFEPSFSVPYSFPVHFTRSLWHVDQPLFADVLRRLEPGRQHRVLAVVDAGLADARPSLIAEIEQYAAAHADAFLLVAPPVRIPGGEASKNDLSHTLDLLALINRHKIDRQSFLVAIGGGATLDTVSFAAATGHRGIRVIRVPTTVLSQADSGIAVKNGINMFGKKNFVGTFAPPFAVINDLGALDSLSLRDRISGVSEIIKVALLKDAGFFAEIEALAPKIAAGDLEALDQIIRPSLDWHLQHICGTGDPFEQGSARPLDFGHWAAHKLESITGNRVRHGEAVAVGMALDIRYAVRAGFLPAPVGERILKVIAAVGLPCWDDGLAQRNAAGELAVVAGLQEFREHLGGTLHITMLRDIQAPFEVTEMDAAIVAECITDLTPVR